MPSSTSFLCRCLLLLALLLFGFLSHGQQVSPIPSVPQSYSDDLNLLWQDLTRQRLITETLLNLLTTPTFNSENFLALYNELINLQQTSEQRITDLEKSLTDTQSNYESIKKDLSSARDYSKSLEISISEISKSLNDYKQEANNQIKALQSERDWWRLGAIAGGIGTIGFIVTLIIAIVK